MKTKKMIAIMLSCFVMCGLAACSKSEADAENSSKSETSAAEEKESEITPADSSAVAETDSEEIEATNYELETPSDMPDAYKDVLDEIRTVMETGEVPGEEDVYPTRLCGLFEICQSSDKEYLDSHIGYALIDLDEDGSDELVIGCLADEDRADPDSPIGRAGYQILDIYTLDGDSAELVIDAWGRNSWFITNDNKLVNWGSSGAAFVEFKVYDLSEGIQNMTDEYFLYSDYDFETDVISLYEVIGDGDPAVVCTGEDFNYFDDKVAEYLNNPRPIQFILVNGK